MVEELQQAASDRHEGATSQCAPTRQPGPGPGGGSSHICVAVVEDHPLYREGLARTVEEAPDMVLVAAVPSLEAFTALAPPQVDVVVLDLHLPDVSGVGGVLRIRDSGAHILVLSASSSHELVVDAMAAGADGYLTKQAEPSEIVVAIRSVADGGSYISPTLASLLLRTDRGDHLRGPIGLSEREKQVLRLVAQGERDTDIAEELFISVRTVRSHLDRIRDKTGRRRRADLARLAVEQGILDPAYRSP